MVKAKLKLILGYTLKNYLEVSFYLWLLHLALPALSISGEYIYGCTLVFVNLFGIMLITLALFQFNFVILSNYPVLLALPFYFLSMLFIYNKWTKYAGLIFGVLSLLLAFSYFVNPDFPVNSFSTKVAVTPHVGFYVWLLSCGILIGADFYNIINANHSIQNRIEK